MLWFLFVLIVGLGVYRLIAYHNKVKKYYPVVGTVVGNDIKTVEDALMGDKYFYAAIVEFTDNMGATHHFISGEDNPGRPIYKEGSSLNLLVHPNDPSKFMVQDIVGGYIIPIIWIIIGIAIPLIPILYPETFR
jgi:hypothetical protein